ncbi:GIY-YIG nuclease family protein [Candidatus Wolfebacteria bacterium]|nr:GIY-YIG nuclease family protein [Candidatus Wolfebacteria bacterium]
MAHVYILKSEGGRYYIGSTTNIQERLRHHTGGYTPSTKKLGKLQMVFSQEYPTISEARYIEQWLKKLKRRDYIEKIVKEGTIQKNPPR